MPATMLACLLFMPVDDFRQADMGHLTLPALRSLFEATSARLFRPQLFGHLA